MGIFKYLRKVLQNKDDVYEHENRILREAGSFLITLFVCVGILVIPPLRTLFKWIAYFSVGSCAFFLFCVFINSLREIWKSFRYAKKLEKLGSSVEEEEMARRALCEMEGDDGLVASQEG